MSKKVETCTPDNTPVPIGPYNHVAKVGSNITIGGVGGVDPKTGKIAGTDIYSQTEQILRSFDVMLRAVGSDLNHVVHINIFMRNMDEFELMNDAYKKVMDTHTPARTVFGVNELPKKDFLLTMNLTAVTAD